MRFLGLLVGLKRLSLQETPDIRNRLNVNNLEDDIKKLNSVSLVRERTIPTERPPLVGEVSANFYGQSVLRGQHNEFPRPLISVF
jgi:hypothetical protein